MFLNDNDFHSVIFELKHGRSSHWNLENINSLSFNPFKVDNCLKSKANFVDNFCDPDEQLFTKVDSMTEKCKYFVEDSFSSLTNKPIQFSMIHFNIRSLRKHRTPHLRFTSPTCYLIYFHVLLLYYSKVCVPLVCTIVILFYSLYSTSLYYSYIIL